MMRQQLAVIGAPALVLAATACGTPTQSGRTLPKGKIQATITTSRTTASIDDSNNSDQDSESAWHGTVSVRAGIEDHFDIGAHVSRFPTSGATGTSENLSGYAIDPKAMLTPVGAATAVSIGIPLGVFVADQGDELALGAWTVSPTVYLGHQMSPTLELVVAPRFTILIPDEDGDSEEDNEYAWGGSIGLRFTDVEKRWAVHPELALTRYSVGSDTFDSDFTLVTLGIGVGAGN